ncbi:MAG: AcrR family transcriptional regulator [Myxococcota bacterium]|jgi:AcrR family transcriptional regulator
MDSDSFPLDPRKVPRQSRSQALRDALVVATVRVLSEEGYQGATTKRIAKAAGVSIGSLYQYFPSKEALVHAVSLEHFDDVLARLAAVSLATERPLGVVIGDVVQSMIDAHAIDPVVHQAITEQQLRVGPGACAEIQSRSRSLVQGIFQARADEVTVRRAELAAWLLVTTVEGAVHAALLEDVGRLRDPAFSAELTALICAYLQA